MRGGGALRRWASASSDRKAILKSEKAPQSRVQAPTPRRFNSASEAVEVRGVAAEHRSRSWARTTSNSPRSAAAIMATRPSRRSRRWRCRGASWKTWTTVKPWRSAKAWQRRTWSRAAWVASAGSAQRT